MTKLTIIVIALILLLSGCTTRIESETILRINVLCDRNDGLHYAYVEELLFTGVISIQAWCNDGARFSSILEYNWTPLNAK